ncbi:UDP-3-O-(3-hydroxymyristoyl)glucosamine N-acyltransferase [Albibacterium profundi]|uniref:UDP-3-O-acylglucosamine N-acyltransferase n=1 Tax=Albibacterium profundi TaxID=3134906 RepID=A0ABV5CDE0_9SPHI
MQFTAQQISDIVNGTVEGDVGRTVSEMSKIEEGQAGSISFLANPKYENYLYTTNASIVIINEDLILKQAVKPTLIRVKNAYTAFSILLDAYNQLRADKSGIEEPSFIHPTATIGKNVYIGAFAYIGPNVRIGDHTKIYPNSYIGDSVEIGSFCTIYAGVKIYFDSIIGERVIIHAGAVIGSDGFGFAPQDDRSYKKISQIGNVLIGDDVEIGANTTIDRATLGSTKINNGVKLDNLIQLAHNVEVGKNTVVAAQTGISGSTKVGENVVLGGQVGVAGHITVANDSQVQAQSGINRSITEVGKKWAGTPAIKYTSQMRIQVTLQKLPGLEKRIEQLENLINKS